MQMQIIIEHILRSEKMNILNVSEKMVLYMLSSFMGNKTNCFPSRNELARVCSISVKTLDRTIKLLEEKNIIHIKRNHHTNNLYSFNPSWLIIFDSLNVKLSPRSVKMTRGGVKLSPHGASNCPPNNIINNIINNKQSYPQPKFWTGIIETALKASPLLEEKMKNERFN
jgi:Helix-turn-helix domain